MDLDDDVFAAMFALGEGQGAVPMLWEQAVRCDECLTDDTKQPRWGQECAACGPAGGNGVVYLPGEQVTGLFRSRTQYQSYRQEGELAHGEAELTTPLNVKPGFVDRLVKDRFTILAALGDAEEGTAFYPTTTPVAFIFNGVQRAWRVQVALAKRSQELVP